MNQIITSKIEQLLSREYHCSRETLREKGTVFSVNTNGVQPYIKIAAYRNCVIVCTSEELQEKVRELLRGKSRDEIFELPLVYGQTIHYVPGNIWESPFGERADCACEMFWKEEIPALKGLTGFENSLVFDERGDTAARAACIVKDGEEIIGVAGASETPVSHLWEVGVDVKEPYRGRGLATCLVSRLTKELQAREIVPFYSASVTNIGSQMVASRCAYIPAWVDTFGTTLDGSSAYRDIVRDLSL